MFPLADARGRVRGFQARQLYEDDPLRAKYVNSPEGDLFRKGDLLYGLDLARAAIAKQDRALIVEGNPDAIALRQAGFEPAVAAMGTALTESAPARALAADEEPRALLRRRRRRPGGDAARDGARRRQGFDIRVVSLPPGTDPADDPAAFEAGLDERRGLPPVPGPGRDRARAPDRNKRLRAGPRGARSAPGLARAAGRRPPCRRPARAAGEPPGGARAGGAHRAGRRLTKVLEAGVRLERNALAGARAFPDLSRCSTELAPEHFDLELHRRVRERFVSGGSTNGELTAAIAELDAWAAEEAIDEADREGSTARPARAERSNASSSRRETTSPRPSNCRNGSPRSARRSSTSASYPATR